MRHAQAKLGALFVLGAIIGLAGFSFTNTAPAHSPHPDTLKKRELAAPIELTMPTPQILTEASTISAPPQHGIAAGGGLWWVGEPEHDAYFKEMKQLGATWVRWDLDWSLVQPDNESTYDWAKIDMIVNAAERNGVKSLPILTYTPQWARSSLCWRHDKCRPLNPDTFGRFARAAAERYKGKIHHWEIWNEQNYTMFWEPKPSVSDYSKILKAAYTNIKAVDKTALVISGGLAATGDETDGSLSPITFMRGLYDSKANAYFDAVALHPYTYPAAPTYVAWWNRWQQIDPIRQLMVERGDSYKQIWITEFGAPSGGPGRGFSTNEFEGFDYGTDFMTETSQVQIATQAVDFYEQRTAWMGPFFWYSLHDSPYNQDDIGNNFGLIRRDGSHKPVYDFIRGRIR